MKHKLVSAQRLEGTVVLPGDKSISQRALLLNSISTGTAHVSNICEGDDRTSILRCLRGLGVRIKKHSNCTIADGTECFEINGNGPNNLEEPSKILNAGNSATTLRIVSGLLATQPFLSIISGDRSLRTRPMDRIIKPLNLMGAKILGRANNSTAPLAIRGGNLHGIEYVMPVSSAQVKSCLLLSGLYARGETTIVQPSASRDHTERMLAVMGADLKVNGLNITVSPSTLKPLDIKVPGDISSAAFWIVAALIHPNAQIRLEGVGINNTRTGILDVLGEMGARITIENLHEEAHEPVADLVVESSELVATHLHGEIIPKTIDELPILALAASCAKGTTVISGAEELNFKESNRIQSTVDGLSRLGVQIEGKQDGMVIKGQSKLKGTLVNSHGDHRIAMTMGIASLIASGKTQIDGGEAASVSYPSFWTTLNSLRVEQTNNRE